MSTQHADAPIASTEKKKRSKKSKNKSLAQKNLKNSAKDIEKKKKGTTAPEPEPKKTDRVLMYQYEEGMTQSEKKTFRRKTRAAIARLKKNISKMEKAEKKGGELSKEDRDSLKVWRADLAKIISNNHNPEFANKK